MKIEYDTVCELTCTSNDNKATAEVDMFQPEKYITVFLAGIRINMQYLPKHNLYVGNSSGLEFLTPGPKQLN